MSAVAQRVIGAAVLLAAGTLALPVAASFLDNGSDEWIVPIYVTALMTLGVLSATLLPAMAGSGHGAGRRVLTGAGWGLLTALAGTLAYWLLLGGR